MKLDRANVLWVQGIAVALTVALILTVAVTDSEARTGWAGGITAMLYWIALVIHIAALATAFFSRSSVARLVGVGITLLVFAGQLALFANYWRAWAA